MKNKPKPKFFALHKDFNDGKVKYYDVLGVIFNTILTEKNKIKPKEFILWSDDYKKVPIRTKEQLNKYITQEFRYYFWANASWEFVAIDWPYRDTVDNSRPVKIDIFEQLEPNIPVIVDLVWDYLEPQIKKLIEKENE